MSIKNDLGLLEKFDELKQVGSAKVTILHDQVAEIVVADLMAKYKYCLKRKKGDEWAAAFKKVLRYYLDDAEILEMEQIVNQQD